jgi:LmbE family N-acetylglucosaminyl deacetylase
MLNLVPDLPAGRPLRILCIGAHSDDLEIGCGATILSLLAGARPVEVTWVVLCAGGARAHEARRSARALLARAATHSIRLAQYPDTRLGAEYAGLKDTFDELGRTTDPHVVLSHRLEDRHQDHRLVAELTWNTWRDHVIFEYEIPKYEGDLGSPNVYVPVPVALARRKVRHIEKVFASQRGKHWFTPETFLGLMRIRGVECRSRTGLAEAFHARKLRLG